MIDVIELQPSDESIDYIGGVLSTPYIAANACEGQQSASAMLKVFDRFRVGFYKFFVPAYDGQPMGMVWGWMYCETLFLVHLAYFREFWGKRAHEAGVEVEDAIRGSTGCKGLIGFIPVTNRASHLHSLKQGFEFKEMCSGLFIKDGKDIDCWKMVKEY